MSMVVVGLIWRTIYNPVIGPIARLVEAMGFKGAMPDLIGQSSTVMYAMSASIIWFAIGFYCLVYMGGLSNISTDIYEAADIDGVSKPQKLAYITLPLLMPSITINVVVSIIGILMEFQLPLTLTAGGPGFSSQTMALRSFLYATREMRPGMSMALSVLLTIVAVGISVIMTNILRKKEVEH
jgi:ABC-type sugar transport system permease subunit